MVSQSRIIYPIYHHVHYDLRYTDQKKSLNITAFFPFEEGKRRNLAPENIQLRTKMQFHDLIVLCLGSVRFKVITNLAKFV